MKHNATRPTAIRRARSRLNASASEHHRAQRRPLPGGGARRMASSKTPRNKIAPPPLASPSPSPSLACPRPRPRLALASPRPRPSPPLAPLPPAPQPAPCTCTLTPHPPLPLHPAPCTLHLHLHPAPAPSSVAAKLGGETRQPELLGALPAHARSRWRLSITKNLAQRARFGVENGVNSVSPRCRFPPAKRVAGAVRRLDGGTVAAFRLLTPDRSRRTRATQQWRLAYSANTSAPSGALARQVFGGQARALRLRIGGQHAFASLLAVVAMV